jgi:hypothetical protein
VGTGLWIAGGNDNVVRYNHFYDNWRRGTMLFAVPDATVCGPPPVGSSSPVPGCDSKKFSTSYNDHFYGNTMGVSPSGAVQPNGTDFWWDNFPSNTGNCWYQNAPAPGKSITSSPSTLPDCSNGADPSMSMGTGDPGNESELTTCLGAVATGGYDSSTGCAWFTTPPKPGSARDAAWRRSQAALRTRIASDPSTRRQICRLYRTSKVKGCART